MNEGHPFTINEGVSQPLGYGPIIFWGARGSLSDALSFGYSQAVARVAGCKEIPYISNKAVTFLQTMSDTKLASAPQSHQQQREDQQGERPENPTVSGRANGDSCGHDQKKNRNPEQPFVRHHQSIRCLATEVI